MQSIVKQDVGAGVCENLYNYNGEFVSVDSETGDIKPFDGLLTSEVKSQANELEAVVAVRLPVIRDTGEVELLKPGFDNESKIFTVDRLTYDKEMPLDEARDFLNMVLAPFPFAVEGLRGDLRARGLAVAGILSVYCQRMFDQRSSCRSFVYRGSGAFKEQARLDQGVSLLREMAVSLLWPDPATRPHGMKEVSGGDVATVGPSVVGVQSILVDKGLVFGGASSSFVSFVDLVSYSSSSETIEYGGITERWVRSDGARQSFLAACWAVVREWASGGGCAVFKGDLPSRRVWQKSIGGLVELYDPRLLPFSERLVELGGVDMTQALKVCFDQVSSDFEEGENLITEREMGAMIKDKSWGSILSWPDGRNPLLVIRGETAWRDVGAHVFQDAQGRECRWYSKKRNAQDIIYCLEISPLGLDSDEFDS